MIDNLIIGFQAALSVENLIWCFVGVLLGTVIGILPGLGSATGVAILLPLTLAFDPLTGLIMLAGIYHGSQYGATITAILIATPGEASSVVSTLDGYQMARNGRAGPALAISAVSSFASAIVSVLLLFSLSQVFADIALGFGPIEILAIMVFGFATISVFAAGNVLLGLAMSTVGVLLACVGIDMGTGVARYTFGSVDLFSGIPFVEVMIGLFALGELLSQLDKGAPAPIRARFKDMLLTKEDIRRATPATFRGMVIGFAVGILPGAGSTLASFLAYGSEKRFSKHRSEMGSGAIEGVAAPDAATSAATNGAFVPTLTLGVPGGATTAVLLGAFLLYGITPGPLLFEQQPVLVWGLLVSFLIGQFFLLVLNLPMAPVFAQLLRLRYGYLYPLIIFTSFIGAYAISNNSFSLWVVLVFGVIGYLMKRLNFPIAPLVLGLVIGPLFEKALVQTSALTSGDSSVILQSPTAVVILTAALLLLVGPKIVALIRGKKGASGLGIENPETSLAEKFAGRDSGDTDHREK
ncbi:tripartite tricarboxylate transporter permease [Salinibacterium sp. PAMC 21357]|uniref:tripartite tricarboxylate transporter permease n=1 Tax=Salinibacterium sp. PAMC 21357 TaxID=1112215 RepID=UPI000289A1D5|nr:tripartite tricarboxylate transporter permease [Salinibacterium sp. PAMC 21357]